MTFPKTLLTGVAAIGLSLSVQASAQDAAQDAAAAAADAAEAAMQSSSVEMVIPPEHDPSELQVLFWDDPTRSARFRDMESWFAGHEVPAASETRGLPEGEALSADLAGAIDAAMEQTNAVGVMVLQNGKVRYENYRMGMGSTDRWTSFSVAKSFTSTLLGAALADGAIASLDDPVTEYVPGLAGSAYDGVTVRQIATMTSGVAWNEDYTDPNSDVAQMNRFVVEYGPDAIVEQMKRLDREAPAGEKWVYKTGETNLIGMVVENAVGMSLAEYAQSKIVEPAGFEGGLFWMVDPRGGNIGGCCLSLRLSDYARMGQFALEGGKGTVPEGWFEEAGSQLVDFENGGFGYGYQWWTYPGGNYGAQGIFGQSITLIPDSNLVLAVVSNWSTATSSEYRGVWGGLAFQIATAQ